MKFDALRKQHFKPKTSAFIVTVNTNQKYETLLREGFDVEEFLRKLKVICDNVLRRKDIFIPRGDSALTSKDIISNELTPSAVSIGPTGGTLHYHALVKVTYTGNNNGYFHLTRELIHSRILSQLPLDNIYVNFKHVKNFSTSVADYITQQNALDPNFDYDENLKKYGNGNNENRGRKNTSSEA